MLARIHLTAVLVERPERVPEQTRRVILLLECDEALPVLAEGCSNTRGDFVPPKELRVTPLHMRNTSFTSREESLPKGRRHRMPRV
jgi:hypothetical protein